MKNAHGVEPTRFMKRNDSRYSIECNPCYGPIFGNYVGSDIYIRDKCNKRNSCYIKNNGTYGYECDHEHRKSLFVNTAGLIKIMSLEYWIMKYLVLIMKTKRILASYVNILILYGNI